MARNLHLLKLCVGAESVADLEDRQAGRGGGLAVHVTRMWPRRADALLDGGSFYWVIKGLVLARQKIAGFEPRRGEDGIERCAILLERTIVRTAAQPRRPFQGWRYLSAAEAPRDLVVGEAEDIPTALAAELAAIGVL